MTRKGQKEMRAAFAKTALVVDEGSLASTVQARDLLRVADALRIPRVVLVGDEKQIDAVDAGKPFAQLQRAGIRTAVMDEIMRQRDPALKEAVEASLAGDVKRAFAKLGDNIAEVKPDNLAGAAAARWLALSPEARANAGLMAPSHAIRERINEIVRERLVRDGTVHGPAMAAERLISRGYTNAEKTLAANYARGDVVAFHRPYTRLGVGKGDELRVAGVDRKARAVMLEGKDGRSVAWSPNRLAARSGDVEVYRAEEMELRAGDRIRWTRNDAGLGLVNSQTAEVAAVAGGKVSFRLGDGRMLDLAPRRPAASPYRPGMGLDRACVPGAHRRYRDRRDGGQPSEPHHAEDPVCGDLPSARPGGAGDRRQGGAARDARSGDRGAHRGARSGRAGTGEGARGRARRAPERGPRGRCRWIAGAGTIVRAGNGTGLRAEERRPRSWTVGVSRGERWGGAGIAGGPVSCAILKLRRALHISCSITDTAWIIAALAGRRQGGTVRWVRFSKTSRARRSTRCMSRGAWRTGKGVWTSSMP